MTRTGVAVVALVVAGAAVAQTRRPPAPAGVPLVTRLPSHLHDPAIVAELKLTPEQVKTLSPRGAKKGPPADDAPASVGTRVKEVLTPEQYARAVQLMAQDALRAGRGGVVTPAALVAVPASAFRRYPELADAAKLTREQRRRVTASAPPPNPNFGGPQPTDSSYGGLPGAAHVLLEPEQTAALATFVGPLRTTPFGAATPTMPTGPGVGRPVGVGSGPPWQRVMLAVNNRGELKLSDEQTTTLTNLMNTARGVVRPGPDGTVPTPPRPQTPAETEAALEKALNPTQRTRLRQIELWQQLPPNADATARFDVPRVSTEIGLSNDQQDELKAVAAAHRDKAAAALKTAATAADLKEALAAARAEVAGGVDKLLTDEQRTTLAGLFGAEYRGGSGGGIGGPDNDFFRRVRAASFGHYQFEMMIVNRFAGVAEDLRLTEEQKTAITAAETAINQQYRRGLNYESPEPELAKQFAEQSKAMQQAFDTHFTPAQRKRFRELCIQVRQQLTAQQLGNGGMYLPTAVPGVAADLKLTPDQRKRLIETGDEDGTLTAEQRAELKRLAGPPLAGGFDFGFGGRGGRPVPPSARLALLYGGAAHADLRLTAEQTHLIAETIEVHAAELRPATTGRTGELGGYIEPPQPEAVADTVAACEKACHSVLTAAQRERLGQLVLQAAADASLTTTFARPEVSDKLAFTSEQRTALGDITSDFRARVGHISGLPSTAGWPELRRQALADARAAARARMMAVLSPPQAAAWRGLTGPPCPAVAALPPTGDDTRDP